MIDPKFDASPLRLRRAGTPLNPSVARFYPQLGLSRFIVDLSTPCQPNNEVVYHSTIGAMHPVALGYVGMMRIDMDDDGAAPDARLKICVAMHTNTGGWQWHWDLIPIVIDFGVPQHSAAQRSTAQHSAAQRSAQPGGGHFDVPVKTADVDPVAIVAAAGTPALLANVTCTAIRAPH